MYRKGSSRSRHNRHHCNTHHRLCSTHNNSPRLVILVLAAVLLHRSDPLWGQGVVVVESRLRSSWHTSKRCQNNSSNSSHLRKRQHLFLSWRLHLFLWGPYHNQALWGLCLLPLEEVAKLRHNCWLFRLGNCSSSQLLPLPLRPYLHDLRSQLQLLLFLHSRSRRILRRSQIKPPIVRKDLWVASRQPRWPSNIASKKRSSNLLNNRSSNSNLLNNRSNSSSLLNNRNSSSLLNNRNSNVLSNSRSRGFRK
jgi:hypothetical protein